MLLIHLPRPPPSVLPSFVRHLSPLPHRARPASTGAGAAAAAAGSPLDVAPIYAAGSALINHPVFPSPSNAALDAHLSLPAQDERIRRWGVTEPAAKLGLQDIFDKDFYLAKAAHV